MEPQDGRQQRRRSGRCRVDRADHGRADSTVSEDEGADFGAGLFARWQTDGLSPADRRRSRCSSSRSARKPPRRASRFLSGSRGSTTIIRCGRLTTKFIYFVKGPPLEKSDVWRIPSAGGTPERITRHDSAVSFPTLLDNRTLLYLATDEDGYGPWIYAMDVERRVPHRISRGLEEYTSLAVSADGLQARGHPGAIDVQQLVAAADRRSACHRVRGLADDPCRPPTARRRRSGLGFSPTAHRAPAGMPSGR